ncbi:hypothetical protein CR513_41452, partial [Mucuna pruriens]
MIVREDGEVASDNSHRKTSTSSELKSRSDDSHVEEDLLMVRRLRGSQMIEEAKTQRENIFHFRCHILGMTTLLKEFKDVFPKDIPLGLPPLRSIKDLIDLSLGAILPNKVINKTNPKEGKEIQKQGGKLLEKG